MQIPEGGTYALEIEAKLKEDAAAIQNARLLVRVSNGMFNSWDNPSSTPEEFKMSLEEMCEALPTMGDGERGQCMEPEVNESENVFKWRMYGIKGGNAVFFIPNQEEWKITFRSATLIDEYRDWDDLFAKANQAEKDSNTKDLVDGYENRSDVHVMCNTLH